MNKHCINRQVEHIHRATVVKNLCDYGDAFVSTQSTLILAAG